MAILSWTSYFRIDVITSVSSSNFSKNCIYSQFIKSNMKHAIQRASSSSSMVSLICNCSLASMKCDATLHYLLRAFKTSVKLNATSSLFILLSHSESSLKYTFILQREHSRVHTVFIEIPTFSLSVNILNIFFLFWASNYS